MASSGASTTNEGRPTSTTPLNTTSHPDGEAGGGEAAGSSGHESAVAERAMSSLTLFSTRRPQHFGAGLASGMKNMARGVAAGAASLFALPVMGFKSEGAVGALKGAGLGVLSCAALSIGGVTTGAVQIVRGAVNTPEAVKNQYHSEKLWHPDRREWIEVRLPVLLEAVPRDDSDIINAARARKFANGVPPDEVSGDNRPHGGTSDDAPGYYEVLGVTKSATPTEVKKAYAKMALKHHPDKNVGDAQAADRFKAVGEAYRVLSSEVLRAEYDRTGRRVDAADPDQQRAAHMPGLAIHPIQELLGGEAFVPFIGHLYLTTVLLNDLFTFSEEEAKQWQERRCLRIAGNLVELTRRVTALKRGTEGGGGQAAVTELFTHRVAELVQAPLGREMLSLIAARIQLVARKYQSMSEQSLLGRGAATLEEWRQSAASIGANASMAYQAIRSMRQRALTSDEVAPMLLRLASGDISATVDVAVDYALYDLSVSRDERWERSEVLLRFATFIISQLAVERMD